ncbi:MAG TPA: hypothetical protein VMS98_08520 [Thermoanaerobaculia bacterium]|nr:hypothetical protein [Thermoanaerobaculia bacterium]
MVTAHRALDVVPKSWRIPLLLAGLHDCGLAAYHFFLPYHMQWRRGLDGVADSLVWALFALNFSWSLLLLLAGALIVYASGLGVRGGKFARLTVFTVGLFWAIHGLYTWVNPLPLPPSLLWLRVVLGVFPVVVILLHWLPLLVTCTAHTTSEAGVAAA